LPPARQLYAQTVATTQAALGNAAYHAAWVIGQLRPLPAAAAAALAAYAPAARL
jgi:hypothetical protein